MNTTWTPEQGNAEDVAYSNFLMKINDRAMVAFNAGPVFHTDADLWTRYLERFPEHDRQVHNCNACRHFIERFGDLATINPATGKLEAVLWHPEDAPATYVASVQAMKDAVERAKVIAPFVSELKVLGEPKTGKWTHLYAVNTRPWTNRTETAYQRMSQWKQDFLMLLQALADFPKEVAQKAFTLLEAEALYRSEKFLGPARWFLELHNNRDRLTGSVRNNIIWLAVATAPGGYAHVRSSVIGTLLEDIKDGSYSFDDIKKRFAAKTNTTVYQRAQAAPAAGTIQQAEKLFEQLNLAPALPRRYARLDDIRSEDAVWVQQRNPGVQITKDSVFGHLKAKDTPPPLADLSVPAKAVTWEKFVEKVLPTASKLEVVVPDRADRFMAITTAVNSDAPPLLQWDIEGPDRNPFSWYYASGVDAEIARRVTERGGMVRGVDLRCSLMWEGYNDLDLHCLANGRHIFFRDKSDGRGGYLDVDANAMCTTNLTQTPVENIRWPAGSGYEGTFEFYVHHYQTHHKQPERTPFRVELEVNGAVYHYEGYTRHAGDRVNLPTLQYVRGEQPAEGGGFKRAAGKVLEWGVTPGTYVSVTAVVPSPNLWGDPAKFVHCGRHAFFLLEGCRDSGKGRGRGFFTEQMRGDLRPVRSVIEAHLAQAEVEGAEEATACGIGISSQDTGNLTVRVTTPEGQMLYKIDRWD